MDRFIASQALQDQARQRMMDIPDWTDAAATVSLVTVPFVATQGIDEATIPANAVEYTPRESAEGPGVVFDSGDQQYYLFYPDPDGGWTFVSEAGTYPLTVYGYRVDIDGVFLGCQTISPRVVEGTGEYTTLGEVSLPVAATIFSMD